MNKDKKSLLYSSMAFYIIIYYTFIIFFNNKIEQFEIIRIGFETIALLGVLIAVIIINLKSNKKTLILPTILLIVLCNIIGQGLEIYYEIVLKSNMPNYLAKDTLSSLSVFILFIVFIYESHKKRRGRSITILNIDIIIIMCISVVFTWEFIISPNLTTISGTNIFITMFYISYPIVYLGNLGAAIMLFNCLDKKDPQKKGVLVLAIAFLIMYIANIGYTYLLTSDMYISGNLVDPLWTIYDFLLLVGVIEYISPKYIVKNEKSQKEYKDSNLELNLVLPGLSIASLFIFVTIRPNIVAWIFFGISITLLNIRQYLIDIDKKSLILELEELNRCLEKKVQERTKEIYEVAYYDYLTGLANRRLFEDKVNKLMREVDETDTKLSIMLLDLDRFKAVNDTYGHTFGDLLIKEIAEILKELSDEDFIIARQGGDEFAIAMIELDNKNRAENLAEKILEKFMRPIKLENRIVYTTISMGIASYPSDGKDYEDIIRFADFAMYNSKHLGRNTYSFYEDSMFKSISKRITFERELHNAIDKEQFILHYQPQVDTITKKVIGLEALIRWNHPTQGIISPFQFIDIAEETGLIGPIGIWVLETACKQTKKWHEKGYKNLKIGVNISAHQFEQENFVDIVRRVLIDTNLEPKYLDLEITESIAMKNEIAVITKLKKLKKLGVKVSMDDFGTGYSSLSYLNRFPIDTLKIPREFIKDIKPYHDKRNVIEAIIAIAKNLNLSIIAEGVENKTQLKFLKDRDCDFIQGYLFSKPLPEEDVEEFINKKGRIYI